MERGKKRGAAPTQGSEGKRVKMEKVRVPRETSHGETGATPHPSWKEGTAKGKGIMFHGPGLSNPLKKGGKEKIHQGVFIMPRSRAGTSRAGTTEEKGEEHT